MPDPTYWTPTGLQTLEELLASVDQCQHIVRHAKAVEDAATEILSACLKLRAARDDLQVALIKTKLLPGA